MIDAKQCEVKFYQALMPVVVLLSLIIYGLLLRPKLFAQEPLPLEIIFILAAAFAVCELMMLGNKWTEIQKSIVAKLSKALPAFFILFSIGVIISSWIVSGTIPMLVYYGIKIVDPTFIYLIAFVVPVIFSTLTGTSWGSAGTIGVVLIGIAEALNADLGITAGAIIGGGLFRRQNVAFVRHDQFGGHSRGSESIRPHKIHDEHDNSFGHSRINRVFRSWIRLSASFRQRRSQRRFISDEFFGDHIRLQFVSIIAAHHCSLWVAEKETYRPNAFRLRLYCRAVVARLSKVLFGRRYSVALQGFQHRYGHLGGVYS